MSQKSPGPGTYEWKPAFVKYNEKQNGLGKIKRFEEKSIDYSVQKDFLCKETPGPGQYNFNDHFTKGKYSLGKINPPERERQFKGSEV